MAPIEVPSGLHKIHRLSRRQPSAQPAIHIAAVTQIRHRHSQGRAYYERKTAEGKTGKEALRTLKRRISGADSLASSAATPDRTGRAPPTMPRTDDHTGQSSLPRA